MDKKRFMAHFQGEDPVLLARLHGLLEAAFAGRPLVSAEFFTPAIWSGIQALPGAIPPDAGFYDLMDADRRLFASPLSLAPGGIRLVEVTNLYPARPLAHKDYLGALMNLGVRREKFSDLFLHEDSCCIPMVPEILPYVLDNLVKVGNNGVSVREADLSELLARPRQYGELTVLAASLRLDALIAEITGRSRSNAEGLIASGKVLLNFREEKNRSEAVKPGDVLTIRGYGKYRLGEVQGESRKGKIRLIVHQYL